LGAGSAIPAFGRGLSSQLLKVHNRYILIDCGEGTLQQLMENHFSIQKIDKIFISHLHGDHYFGLMGLLTSMSLLNRANQLDLYAPFGLEEILTAHFRWSNTQPKFPIRMHRTPFGEHRVLVEEAGMQVEQFPLNHRLPCNGFKVSEKFYKRKVAPERLPENFPPRLIKFLANGEDVAWEGQLYESVQYTDPPKPARSYAYCSDTAFWEGITEHVQQVDLLYHEATFADSETERAIKTGHSTSTQAAETAKKANAKKLMLGHFSSRYQQLDALLQEAKRVFPNTILAERGLQIHI